MLTRMEQKIEDIKKYMDEKFENQQSFFSAIAKDICSTVFDKCLLQEQVMSLKHANLQMQNSKEELEQYGRRLCLRINGVPVKSDETSDDVLKYIKEMFDEGELDFSDTVIDRAHRIGPEYSDYKTKKKCKAIIVRFTTFRHRTLVYRARKQIRDVKIRLDLTKERHALLLEANNLVKGNNDVKFCFVDINCRLKIKWEDELRPDSFFSSLEDLKGKLQVN